MGRDSVEAPQPGGNGIERIGAVAEGFESERAGKTVRAQRRKIEPYAVVFYQSSLYIIAAAHDVAEGQDRIRHLKLDRFVKATPLDAFFQRPEKFDLEQHLGQGMGIFSGGKAKDYKIRISARGARASKIRRSRGLRPIPRPALRSLPVAAAALE